MSTVLIEIRRAKASDAAAVADTHDEAWKGAYQGVIPGVELEKLVTRRGVNWWDSAIRKGGRIAILAFGDKPRAAGVPEGSPIELMLRAGAHQLAHGGGLTHARFAHQQHAARVTPADGIGNLRDYCIQLPRRCRP